MIEEWRDIVGYEGYYKVSNLGNVFSIGRICFNGKGVFYKEGKLMKQCKSKNGYFKVNLSKDKKVNTVHIHRLVAEAFIENPNNLPCVNHMNEDKSDNRVENLEWCDYSYNNKYGTGNIKRTNSKIVTWKKKNCIFAA